jgi:hypothetical protein
VRCDIKGKEYRVTIFFYKSHIENLKETLCIDYILRRAETAKKRIERDTFRFIKVT